MATMTLTKKYPAAVAVLADDHLPAIFETSFV